MKIFSKIVLLCLLMIFSTSIFSQVFRVGGRVGINFANVSMDPQEIETNSITGLVIAVPFEIGITENFAVQPELVFLQKGFGSEDTYTFGGQTFMVNYKQVVNQIDIPILAKYLFVNSESLSVYAAAGPVFGYALSGNTIVEMDGDKDKEKIDWDDLDYNRFEMLVSIGAGAGIPAGPGQVVIDLRYLFGLTNLYSGEDDFTVKNNGFQAGVGFFFPIAGSY